MQDISYYFELVRAFIVLIPTWLLTAKLINTAKTPRELVAWLFSFVWQFQACLILWSLANNSNTFNFEGLTMVFIGVPIDVAFGFSLLISYLQVYVRHSLLIAINISVYVALLSLFMVLKNGNFNAVLFLIPMAVLVTIPAHYLHKWSQQDLHIYWRSALQNLNWAVFLLWFFPSIIFHFSSDNWEVLLDRTGLAQAFLFATLMVPGYLIINALYHFAKFGDGTGFPYDAPKRVVTTGVYRHLSNSMQSGIVLMMLIWGMALNSVYIVFSSLVAVFLFIVFKNTCNGTFQQCGTDPNWKDYQQKTPKWIPKFKHLSFYFRNR